MPNYDFQLINGKGTIVKWNGTEQHLVIPEAFLLEVDGEEKCVPVQVIGKAAFMQGDFKSIVILESVQIIEEDNFVEIDIEEIEIPHSVKHIGGGSFIKKNYSSGGSSGGRVIIRNKSGGITIGGGSLLVQVPDIT